ncbi:MAG: M20/M25/M40 family metallo-hydrolase [Thermoplasmata archaeon]|nr:M20/M25/M40 family metallo-hydrolase [Thermoplasmata archaeon]
MTETGAGEPLPRAAAEALGDADALRLLAELVSIAPTNLEDPPHNRYEKPNYRRAADRIVRTAREWGMHTRLFDPVVDGPHDPALRGIPRPNVIVDLDVGAKGTVLILAHYDVVPVPSEQLGRWKTPPHSLTLRANGRLYARGANDDLGSGVVASLLAMRRMAGENRPPRNVRLIVCCDEETGGAGGIEQIRSHDERLPPHDPNRFLVGDVALIPDGSPHATAGSSGLVFLDASFDEPTTLADTLELGEHLVELHQHVKGWRSVYASPDWPDHQAPEPVITGRATVTQLDVLAADSAEGPARLLAAHAETDAANQIAQAVTLVLGGDPESVDAAVRGFESVVHRPFKIAPATGSSLTIPPYARAVQVVGQSAHGGYPHRGANPVPETLDILSDALARGTLRFDSHGTSTFSVDLRLLPEMGLAAGRDEVLTRLREEVENVLPHARFDAPLARARGGYALAPDHPFALRLERLCAELFHETGVFGEYGGTDASSLVGVRTPAGEPLPALVFGSMDREAHIHEAEESVDPKMLLGISETIRRFVLDE